METTISVEGKFENLDELIDGLIKHRDEATRAVTARKVDLGTAANGEQRMICFKIWKVKICISTKLLQP